MYIELLKLNIFLYLHLDGWNLDYRLSCQQLPIIKQYHSQMFRPGNQVQEQMHYIHYSVRIVRCTSNCFIFHTKVLWHFPANISNANLFFFDRIWYISSQCSHISNTVICTNLCNYVKLRNLYQLDEWRFIRWIEGGGYAKKNTIIKYL